MRIKRIRLRNIYQFRDVDITLSGSRIGLVGPNGSGKSRFLAALGEAVHGEFSVNKDRIVTWGEDSGFSMVDISLNDSRGMTIFREFPSGKATLVIGEEKISGPSKVNERILRELETEKSVLENIVFVGQNDIDSILFARSGEKDRLAQKFYGLQSANVIEAAISRELAGLVVDSAADQLTSLFEARGVVSLEITSAENSITKGSVEESASEVEALDLELAKAQDVNSRLQVIKLLRESSESNQARYASLLAEYTADHAALLGMGDMEAARIQFEVESAASRLLLDHQECDRNIESCRARIQSLGEAPVKLGELNQIESDKDAAIQMVEKVRAEISSRKKVLDSIGILSNCPTCGQPVDLSRRGPIEAEVEEMEKKLVILEAGMNGVVTSFSRKSRAFHQWNAESSNLNNELLQHLSKKHRLPPPPSHVPCPEKWSAVIDAYRSMSASLSRRYEELGVIRTELDTVLARISSYEAGMLNLDGTLRQPVDVDAISARLMEARNRQMEMRALAEKVNGLKMKRAMIDDQIQKARMAAAKNKASGVIRSVLTEVRAAFHPDGAPKILVARKTRSLEARINHYLATMKDRFSVTARDGLNFDCHFPGGTARDSELSCGQRVSLAWAFRLAACETFSSTVGLMTMDEPTATFDADKNEAFLDVMDSMKELSEKHGMQFFIATHSPELARMCDQLINVGQITSPTA